MVYHPEAIDRLITAMLVMAVRDCTAKYNTVYLNPRKRKEAAIWWNTTGRHWCNIIFPDLEVPAEIVK